MSIFLNLSNKFEIFEYHNGFEKKLEHTYCYIPMYYAICMLRANRIFS